MQTSSPKTYSGSQAAIGVAFVAVPLLGTTGNAPPAFGEVHLVKITKTLGAATVVTYRIVGGGPPDKVYFTSASLPLDVAPHQPGAYPVAYARVPIPVPTGLKIEVLTDDGAGGTTLSVEVEVVVPR
tara:strand:+ start:645 stop:1025 length:381 start_codon:yes stop_codon:yes gene_type:complete